MVLGGRSSSSLLPRAMRFNDGKLCSFGFIQQPGPSIYMLMQGSKGGDWIAAPLAFSWLSKFKQIELLMRVEGRIYQVGELWELLSLHVA